ncbi:uncharacterized protein LOC114521413 [Dendronephthya gigantea]|uniref:uncharacterized protein LOC114521413 n=1 Tax=Dendronephthya gigantea TaxID=151771 RepID=UPI00106A9346|nr:uncharacterized protein LOC114521413 [Dendronephthya gigantea]
MEPGEFLKVTVDLKKMCKKTNEKYWKSKCDEIAKCSCALLNSFGGKLCIIIENQDVTDSEVRLDNVLRALEQRLRGFMSFSWFKKLIKLPKLPSKQFIYEISSSDRVFCMKSHLYLPQLKQVEEIPPPEALEKVRDMSNLPGDGRSHLPTVNQFILDKSIPVTESDSIQFKYLKEEKTKKTRIANRIINKTNKLTMTISAFANHEGGTLLYGITNDGIIKGQWLTEKDKREINAKVSTVIGKMIWREGAIKKNEKWNIEFVPVKDDENNEVASLFIIRIWVKALPGGVFVQPPESYHIGSNNNVEQMSFEDWCSRAIYSVRPLKPVNFPKNVTRIQWSSATSQRHNISIIFQLNDLHNHAMYQKCTELAKSTKNQPNVRGTATELFVMAIESVVAYKRGMMKKAEEIVAEMEQKWKGPGYSEDHNITLFRMLYARSAIQRAKGEYKSSYNFALKAQQVALLIPPGVLTASFFNHVAILEKVLSQQQNDENFEMENSALNHYIKALQHVKASEVENEFVAMIADLEQRIHIFRAITILGRFDEGTDLHHVTPAKIQGAKDDLSCYESLVLDGFFPSKYRKTYSLFARCDLHLAQWYQEHMNQRQPHFQRVGFPIPEEIPNLLKEAYDLASQARELSKNSCFDELYNYANIRLGKITEIMIKVSIALSFPKRVERGQMKNMNGEV